MSTAVLQQAGRDVEAADSPLLRPTDAGTSTGGGPPPALSLEGEGAAAAATARRRRTVIKLVAFVVYFVGTVASTILGKRTTIAAPTYPFALTILSPLAGLCVYPAIAIGLSLAGYIRKESRQVPLWKCAAVGVLFCLHNVLENLGNRGDVVPGPIVLILLKSIVPITFATAYLVPQLRPKYRWTHYLAVALLLAGIATTLGSDLSALSGFSLSRAAGFMCLLLASVLPLAAAFIFIEVQLKYDHPQLHPTVLWAYVCVFEALVGVPLAFLNASLQGLPMSDVWSNTVDGLNCFVAGSPAEQQSITLSSGRVELVSCAEAHKWYFAAMIPGFAFNLAMPVCTKYGSATMLWFVRALALPVASVLFSLRSVMGSHASKLSGWEWGGLVVVFAATVMYNHYPTARRGDGAATASATTRPPQPPTAEFRKARVSSRGSLLQLSVASHAHTQASLSDPRDAQAEARLSRSGSRRSGRGRFESGTSSRTYSWPADERDGGVGQGGNS